MESIYPFLKKAVSWDSSNLKNNFSIPDTANDTKYQENEREIITHHNLKE